MGSMLAGPANLAFADIGIIVHILLCWVLITESQADLLPDHLPKRIKGVALALEQIDIYDRNNPGVMRDTTKGAISLSLL